MGRFLSWAIVLAAAPAVTGEPPQAGLVVWILSGGPPGGVPASFFG